MIVAVSLVMQKNCGTQYTVHARLSIIKECASINEAIGIATVRAIKDEAEYTIASVCASEVIMPPAEIKGELFNQGGQE
jgi:hypothetical protein